jgi:hypothetical protein
LGRWDRFYEARSITSEELLEREVVKTLVEDLTIWPPPVLAWTDAKAYERFAPALAPDCPRPSNAVFASAFELARWELERAYDAIDEFYRNDRAARIASDPRERLCLVFLHKWLTDSMLEILGASVLKRPSLVECLRRAELRLLSG